MKTPTMNGHAPKLDQALEDVSQKKSHDLTAGHELPVASQPEAKPAPARKPSAKPAPARKPGRKGKK